MEKPKNFEDALSQVGKKQTILGLSDELKRIAAFLSNKPLLTKDDVQKAYEDIEDPITAQIFVVSLSIMLASIEIDIRRLP